MGHKRKVANSYQCFCFLAYFHQTECSRGWGQSGWIHLLDVSRHTDSKPREAEQQPLNGRKIVIFSYVSSTQTNCSLARIWGYLYCFENGEHKGSNHCVCPHPVLLTKGIWRYVQNIVNPFPNPTILSCFSQTLLCCNSWRQIQTTWNQTKPLATSLVVAEW